MAQAAPKRGSSMNRHTWELRITDESRRRDQDEESFEVKVDGKFRRLRLHDYDQLYRLPGLYEQLVYRKLKCKTPWRLIGLLRHVLRDWNVDASTLNVLDLGAGNGIVGERLQKVGVRNVIGADIIPEAEMAAQRDRPEVYSDYIVADFTALDDVQKKALEEEKLNCLTTAAALGFGDIPPKAFAEALALIEVGGWIAVSIKDSFLSNQSDPSGFAQLMRRLTSNGILEVQAWHRHHHRLSLAGKPLFYVALVARKKSEMPESLLDGLK
jgi:trans-aconitate methyltransferase